MVNFLPLQLKEHFYRLISHDFWWEFVNFYAERLIFLPFYGYRSSPFTPLKNLLSPNLGKSMSETCQDLETEFKWISPYLLKYVKFPSSVSWSFDEWNQIKMLPAKQRLMKIASVIKKTKQNKDNNNNSNNNYQCRPRWDK